MTILAMGDSTTAGTPYYRSPVEVPPNGLGDATASFGYWIEKAHPGWKVLNRGVNGQRADAMLPRLEQDLLAIHPDAVVVLAGVVDLHQGASAETVIRRLEALYGTLRNHGIRTIACTILPYDAADARVRGEMARVNAWIMDYAGRQGLVFCDAHQALESPRNPGTLINSEDGLHPARAGYRLLGETIGRCIER